MGIRDIFRKIWPRLGTAEAKLPTEGEKLIEGLRSTNEILAQAIQTRAQTIETRAQAIEAMAKTSEAMADATLAINEMSDRMKERIAAIKDAAGRRQAGGTDPARGR